jgi:hypothetical protein
LNGKSIEARCKLGGLVPLIGLLKRIQQAFIGPLPPWKQADRRAPRHLGTGPIQPPLGQARPGNDGVRIIGKRSGVLYHEAVSLCMPSVVVQCVGHALIADPLLRELGDDALPCIQRAITRVRRLKLPGGFSHQVRVAGMPHSA